MLTRCWLLASLWPTGTRSLGLYITDEAGHKYVLKAGPMDEAETQAAFQTLHKAHPAGPITLLVDENKENELTDMAVRIVALKK
ncbi:hypothetical protein [Hymenobacter psychrotolerans]|uniref:Uncharacterized protein n=1 Tax=Hymenobacter psychrotolerans DSM 18569 TaxID=1121959 RepID=A0A1M7G6E4_9BACT|nr:hypothetical protein [Hymenobacter psychrotolerans]SHM11517.1 hypothetical protein SAMN02746009_03959 [Hymenobacter psychrotolerans DSM 18569]